MDAFLRYQPIAKLLLEDLRGAASYLEELGDGPAATAAIAREHARRLWSASQAVERLIEHLVLAAQARRAYEGRES
jgi:hypothetical protein